MPQSLAHILIHVIFSTKNRVALIQPDIEQELYPYLAAICRAMECPTHAVGGTADHIHLACSLARTVTVAQLLEAVKKQSSKWLKTKGASYAAFSWQAGYGVFSCGRSQLPAVQHYIRFQKEHHRTRTFQEEFRDFLNKYQIPYDERHVWN